MIVCSSSFPLTYATPGSVFAKCKCSPDYLPLRAGSNSYVQR